MINILCHSSKDTQEKNPPKTPIELAVYDSEVSTLKPGHRDIYVKKM